MRWLGSVSGMSPSTSALRPLRNLIDSDASTSHSEAQPWREVVPCTCASAGAQDLHVSSTCGPRWSTVDGSCSKSSATRRVLSTASMSSSSIGTFSCFRCPMAVRIRRFALQFHRLRHQARIGPSNRSHRCRVSVTLRDSTVATLRHSRKPSSQRTISTGQPDRTLPARTFTTPDGRRPLGNEALLRRCRVPLTDPALGAPVAEFGLGYRDRGSWTEAAWGC